MADIIIAAMEQRHVGEVAAIEEKCFSMPWSAAACTAGASLVLTPATMSRRWEE